MIEKELKIREVSGDYAANIQPETIMVRNSQSSAINSDIARLKGARLVTSVEPNEGVRIISALRNLSQVLLYLLPCRFCNQQ